MVQARSSREPALKGSPAGWARIVAENKWGRAWTHPARLAQKKRVEHASPSAGYSHCCAPPITPPTGALYRRTQIRPSIFLFRLRKFLFPSGSQPLYELRAFQSGRNREHHCRYRFGEDARFSAPDPRSSLATERASRQSAEWRRAQ